MIPSDLAARLRLLNEASFFNTDLPVTELRRARAIQSDLPELIPGQRILATLQRPLPDGTFNAIVAGRQMTLALNTAANAGDTLELVVTETTPRAVFARLATPEAAPATGSALPSLSQTGRLISFLLTGQPAAQPAALGAGQTLLDAPPTGGAAQLASVLKDAVVRSGLFHESHQVQWVLGKLDTAALLAEPHNRTAPATAPSAQEQSAARGTSGVLIERSIAPGAEEAATTQRNIPIPERILPLVHQQLDALATHQYVWQGQAWPGQAIEWSIEDPEDERGGQDASDGDPAAPEWNSTLRLTLPRLGGVEAQIQLTPAGVALRMRADDPETVAALDRRHAELASALEAANLPVTGMVVEPRR
ncbi:MAG: flagellar hook-length control protein FliK [Thauera sp.]|nr:flagellar hook-length control protein FliK [Thauera sp.]